MRGYAAATLDERWEAQLVTLGATTWWDTDDRYLEFWRDREHIDRNAAVTCALELLCTFAALPELSRICPLPGTARRGALHPERKPGRPVDQRMLGRVRALLAKAESTEFPEEAEALSSRAQELMARHSIDDALLAAADPGPAGPGRASARRLFIDSPYESAKAVLADVVAGANRCRAVWHKNLGLSTVLGFPGDLDAVELLSARRRRTQKILNGPPPALRQAAHRKRRALQGAQPGNRRGTQLLHLSGPASCRASASAPAPGLTVAHAA